MENLFRVYNDQGVPFNVRIVRLGDRYGLNDCLVHGEKDRRDHRRDEYAHAHGTMVEFYDTRHTEGFGPRGQFVARYYVDTFRDIREGHGLDLYGGCDSWKIDGSAVTQVSRWLTSEGV